MVNAAFTATYDYQAA